MFSYMNIIQLSVQLSLAVYAVFSFVSTGFEETFPVYADSSKIYGKVPQPFFIFKLEFVRMIAPLWTGTYWHKLFVSHVVEHVKQKRQGDRKA